MFFYVNIVRLVNIGLVLLLMGSLYLIFGESGIMGKKNDAQQHLNTQTQKLQMLQKQNAQKEHNISLLQGNNMDLDMLEEQNRRLFNTHKEDEIQVILD